LNPFRSRREFLTLLGMLCFMLVSAYVVAEFTGARYLGHSRESYQREIVRLREHRGRYRRPVVLVEPLQQNAAIWYRLALPHLSGWRDDGSSLGTVVNGGSAQYGVTITPLVTERCIDTQSVRVQNALRSTYSDWEISPGDLVSFDYTLEAFRLAECLTVDGHRAAYKGDRRAAARAYFTTLSVGCDLGAGTVLMGMVGVASADSGLKALAQLVMSDEDDRGLLREISQQLSQFEGQLPSAEAGLKSERLWLQNALALDGLTSEGGRYPGLGLLLPKRAIAAWHLWQEGDLLGDLDRLIDVHDRTEELRLLESIKRRSEKSGSAIVRESDLARDASFALAVDDLLRLYGAVQTAITLQDWRITHHRYPDDVSDVRAPLEQHDLQYQPTKDRQGYKLVGPRAWETADVIILERQPPG
jgi:hypothetical protein